MSDFFSRRSGGLAGGLPGGLKMAAIGLLVQQLMKHSRTGTNEMPAGEATPGGGIGDILGGLLGGGTSSMPGSAPGSMAGGLGGLLGGGGGLGGLIGGLSGMLGGLRSQGLGQEVDSWVSPGPNQQISPRHLEQSMDAADIDEAARHAGTDRETILNELSNVLPQFVDQATPQGRVPQSEGELGQGGLGSLLNGLLGKR